MRFFGGFCFTLIMSLIMSFAGVIISGTAWAQNTGGIFPPTVNEGHKSLQYRITVDPDDANGETGWAQRLHYQQAINGDFMWRVVGQTKKTAASDINLDYIQGELFWDLSDDTDAYRTGLRFDARIRDDNRSEVFGLHWMHQYDFSDKWQARFIGLSFVQSGDNAANGVNLQTRGNLTRRLGGGKAIGVEYFNNFGNTGSIGDFNDQRHSIGPFLSTPLTDDVSLWTGALFGLSRSAADTELRLWITKSFK